jgi:MFS family permease
MAGTYSGAFTLALVASTLLWGQLSDRRGNRLVLICVSALQVMLALFPLLFAGRVSYVGFTLAFALTGIVQSGSDISLLGMSLELAPAAQRSLYLGLLNTILGVVSFLLIVGGWIVTRWGLEAVFVVSAALALVSLVLVMTLRDPRRRDQPQSASQY